MDTSLPAPGLSAAEASPVGPQTFPTYVCEGDLHLSPQPSATLQLRQTHPLPRKEPVGWDPQSRGWRGTRAGLDSEG